MLAIEPQVREFCAHTLDPLRDAEGFDFVGDLGAQMPMRVIGLLLGIPESDQEKIRDRVGASLKLDEAVPKIQEMDALAHIAGMFSEYIDWRAEHPSDDLMTDLLTIEFEDETGTRRRLTRIEVLTYTNMLAAAGKRREGLESWLAELCARPAFSRFFTAAYSTEMPSG